MVFRLPSLANIDQLVLLAVLRRGEASAAQVRREIVELVDHEFARGRLYESLDGLEEGGLVRRSGDEDTWPRTYRITAKGRAEIRALRGRIKDFLGNFPRGL